MSTHGNKKKYSLRFGNKDLPSFLLTKENIKKLIFFTTIYSLVFINIFRPFNSETWIPGINNLNYFLYSSLMVLVGLLLISISRVIMYFFVKRISIGYLEYLIWIFAEIFILAVFYVFIGNKVGFIDNYLAQNPNVSFWEANFNVLKNAIANTTWMLLIPYIISFLYLYNEHLIRNVINNKDETIDSNVVQFKDEKDEVRFTITRDKIIYIESADNYCIVKYLKNEKLCDFLLRNSLKKLADELIDTPIQRCHRSFLINFEHVTSLKKDNNDISIEFAISGVKEIPISKTYSDRIMELFIHYSKQN
ncbi:MAG: LytTR family transcriptional regulator [Lentimicrobiaceae bacterium]|nr:LytTR family transcriptional regulator [Lentimicrobiaceae bacterium]